MCTQHLKCLKTSQKEVQILKNNYQTNYRKLYALFKGIWERTFPLKCNFQNIYLQFMHLKPKNVTIISNTERIVHMEYNMFKVQKNMKNTVQMITKGPLS